MLRKGPLICHRPEDGIQTYTVWVRTMDVNKQLLSVKISDDEGLDACAMRQSIRLPSIHHLCNGGHVLFLFQKQPQVLYQPSLSLSTEKSDGSELYSPIDVRGRISLAVG
jgi:hypothetical protein